MALDFNPSTLEAEAGRFLSSRPGSCAVCFRTAGGIHRNPVTKIKKKKKEKKRKEKKRKGKERKKKEKKRKEKERKGKKREEKKRKEQHVKDEARTA